MPLLDHNGVKLYYEVHGDDGAPVVLLTHGYSASSAMWKGQAGPLSDAGYRVVTWDIRGHGQTVAGDDPSRYTPHVSIDDMVALLDTVDASTAVIGGLSLGGYLSLAFHVAHTERVRALMLFDTGPGYRKDDAREKWNSDSRKTGDRLGGGLQLAAHGILVQRDSSVIDSLPSITVPTLLLVGENDKPFLGAMEYMAKKIPGSRHVVIPNAGHAANIDAPEAFNEAVLSFLRDEVA
jgi:pimeloyl-ACP methyl ester carboxylesterase